MPKRGYFKKSLFQQAFQKPTLVGIPGELAMFLRHSTVVIDLGFPATVKRKKNLRMIQFMVLLAMLVILMVQATDGTSWCVARNNLSESLVQSGLDYACRSGAYCGPINPGGRCYLPNTLQSHASYAFNSYYQSKSRGPGSCGFSPAAAVVSTDPSYGTCIYPSSARVENEHGRLLSTATLAARGMLMLKKVLPYVIATGREAVDEILVKMASQILEQYINNFNAGETTSKLYGEVENTTYTSCALAGICCGSNLSTNTGSCVNMCPLCTDAYIEFCNGSSQTCSKWKNIKTSWSQCDQISFIRCSGSTRLNSTGLALLAVVFINCMRLFACLL